MSRYSGQAVDFHLQGSHNFSLNHDEDEDDDLDEDPNDTASNSSSSYNKPADRIRRSHQTTTANPATTSKTSTKINFANEPIQVKLNESYFAREQKLVKDCLANVRQKVAQLQMFNPAKNATQREQQQTWNESVSSPHKILVTKQLLCMLKVVRCKRVCLYC